MKLAGLSAAAALSMSFVIFPVPASACQECVNNRCVIMSGHQYCITLSDGNGCIVGGHGCKSSAEVTSPDRRIRFVSTSPCQAKQERAEVPQNRAKAT